MSILRCPSFCLSTRLVAHRRCSQSSFSSSLASGYPFSQFSALKASNTPRQNHRFSTVAAQYNRVAVVAFSVPRHSSSKRCFSSSSSVLSVPSPSRSFRSLNPASAYNARISRRSRKNRVNNTVANFHHQHRQQQRRHKFSSISDALRDSSSDTEKNTDLLVVLDMDECLLHSRFHSQSVDYRQFESRPDTIDNTTGIEVSDCNLIG